MHPRELKTSFITTTSILRNILWAINFQLSYPMHNHLNILEKENHADVFYLLRYYFISSLSNMFSV